MKIIERIFDATTGETIDIERDATVEEIAARDAVIAKAQAKAQAEAAKAHERAALLERLGITEDEARLLLGGN
jgi:hypothetical protein